VPVSQYLPCAGSANEVLHVQEISLFEGADGGGETPVEHSSFFEHFTRVIFFFFIVKDREKILLKN